MNQYIKNILSTKGWNDIEVMFNDAILECSSPQLINSELDDATYSREVRAKIMAAMELQKLLNKIKISAGTDPVDKISYK